MTCPHANIEITNHWEEWYSNGMFGLPASNYPLRTDIVDQEVHCLDCKAELINGQWRDSPNPLGQHNNQSERREQ